MALPPTLAGSCNNYNVAFPAPEPVSPTSRRFVQPQPEHLCPSPAMSRNRAWSGARLSELDPIPRGKVPSNLLPETYLRVPPPTIKCKTPRRGRGAQWGSIGCLLAFWRRCGWARCIGVGLLGRSTLLPHWLLYRLGIVHHDLLRGLGGFGGLGLGDHHS